jgi:hypothetical protein
VKGGEPVHARIVERYAFDRLVVGWDRGSRTFQDWRDICGKRTLSVLNADFTPARDLKSVLGSWSSMEGISRCIRM